jgi:hypothetical protein
MNSSSQDGGRKGAGRPKAAVKRKHRALQFFDEEWEMIRNRAEERGMVPREYLYALVERDGLDRAPDGMGITFTPRKDLAARLPRDSAELDNTQDEKKVLKAAGKILGSIKSEKKAASSRENGKKGGRPKKNKEPL